MANGDTKTEAMLNVLGNGGTGDEFRGCCNTKTQSYILDAIDRINSLAPGGSSDFNDLENRPQLNGVAMTGSTDITDFVGTDGTSAGEQGLVPAPTATDADKFLKSDGTWATASGGGGASIGRVLTEADMDDGKFKLWLLDSGFYVIPKMANRLVFVTSSDDYWTDDQIAIISRENGFSSSNAEIIFMDRAFGTFLFKVSCLNGTRVSKGTIATQQGYIMDTKNLYSDFCRSNGC